MSAPTSSKVDQALDAIIRENRKSKRGSKPRGANNKASTAAPAGGVQKPKKVQKVNPAVGGIKAPPAPTGESKILITKLPLDVKEADIKAYFQKSIGSVKSVFVTYGENGKSRGIATIIFSKPHLAEQAAKEFNGMKIDSKPIKVEVVMTVPPAAAAKPFADRVEPPKPAPKKEKKAQPKPATADKPKAAKKPGRPGRRPKGRGSYKPKTAEELDQEMTDYFGGNNAEGQQANGGTANGASGEVDMDDIQ